MLVLLEALNGSGGKHKIPYYKAVGPNGRMEAQVSSGKNKNWHIFRVKILIKYLTEKYGSPSTYIPSEYKKEISGKKVLLYLKLTDGMTPLDMLLFGMGKIASTLATIHLLIEFYFGRLRKYIKAKH